LITYKQYVIVPKKPKMGAGKIASQVAHATFMALEKTTDKELIKAWKDSGMCVIVLECPSQQELHGIAKYCEQWGIIHHLYIDEGHTEIPMGTATAFATGILTEDKWWMFSTLDMF